MADKYKSALQLFGLHTEPSIHSHEVIITSISFDNDLNLWELLSVQRDNRDRFWAGTEALFKI